MVAYDDGYDTVQVKLFHNKDFILINNSGH